MRRLWAPRGRQDAVDERHAERAAIALGKPCCACSWSSALIIVPLVYRQTEEREGLFWFSHPAKVKTRNCRAWGITEDYAAKTQPGPGLPRRFSCLGQFCTLRGPGRDIGTSLLIRRSGVRVPTAHQ